MTLMLASVVYGAGVFHGAHSNHQAAPVAPIEETGHRQSPRPGTGANGLGTGPYFEEIYADLTPQKNSPYKSTT